MTTSDLDIPAVMVFAAGRGTRMGALTDNQPKPMIPVAGKPLLDHALDMTQGIQTRVVNTHYLADQIETHLQGRDVLISHEPDLLDTGGGLVKALDLLNSDPVFTLNSDAILQGPNPFGRAARRVAARNGMSAAMRAYGARRGAQRRRGFRL